MSDTPETDHLFDLDNMQYQRDLAMKVLKRLERERDEARAELADHKSALEIANRSADDQMRQKRLAERERDEAREALREMWQSGDAFLPHVDSETINRWRKAAGWDGTK